MNKFRKVFQAVIAVMSRYKAMRTDHMYSSFWKPTMGDTVLASESLELSESLALETKIEFSY